MGLAVALGVGIGMGGSKRLPLPTVDSFTVEALSDETVTITALTYSADTTHVMTTESPTPPTMGDPGWVPVGSAPTEHTTPAAGPVTVYAWANGPGGVSTSLSATTLVVVAAWFVSDANVTLAQAACTNGNEFENWGYSNMVTFLAGQPGPAGAGGATATQLLETATTGIHTVGFPTVTGSPLGTSGPMRYTFYAKGIGGRHVGKYDTKNAGWCNLTDGTEHPDPGRTWDAADAADGWWYNDVYVPNQDYGNNIQIDVHNGSGISYAGDIAKGILLCNFTVRQDRIASLAPSAGLYTLAAASAAQPYYRGVDGLSPGGAGFAAADMFQPNPASAKKLSNTDVGLLSVFSGTTAFSIVAITRPLALGVAETIVSLAAGTTLSRTAGNVWSYQRAGGTAVTGGTVTAAQHELILVDNGTTCTLYDDGVAAWTAQAHGGGSVAATSFDPGVSQGAADGWMVIGKALTAGEIPAVSGVTALRPF